MQLTKRQSDFYELVKKFHDFQVRKHTGEPYHTHPYAVAEMVAPYSRFTLIIEVALGHDLYEECEECTKAVLRKSLLDIGYTHIETSYILTHIESLTPAYTPEFFPEWSREKRKLHEAVHLGGCSKLVQTVKYADIIHNVSNIADVDPEFAKIYLEEKKLVLKHCKAGEFDLYMRACWEVQKNIYMLKN